MNESQPPSLYAARLWLCRNACLCSIALAAATVLCIGVGVCDEERRHHPNVGLFDLISAVIYETAQIMLLNMVTHLESNGWIMFGRIFAVLLVVFLGIQALGKLLGESWQNLQLLGYQRHHIVCGLGRIGWQLVQELLKQRKPVVVIEQNPANELCTDARSLGAVVIIGDATDNEMLAHARLKKAETVYVVTGSDEMNIEAAVDVQEMLNQPGTQDPKSSLPNCFVHIVEPALTEVLRNSLRIDGNNEMNVSAFNVMHNAVRNLIVQHLTPVRPRAPDEVALYVIVGFGPMGQTLAANLAELAHFENRKRARLLILTENAPAAAEAFFSRWGQFSPSVIANDWSGIAFNSAADAWSYRLEPHRPGPAYQVADERAIEYACNAVFAPCPPYIGERGFLNALTSLLKQPGVKPAIIVCIDREQEGYGAAVMLEQSLRQIYGVCNVPIFVWLPKQEPLKRLLTGERRAVTPFGSCRDELRLQNVVDPLEEKLAIALMAAFNHLDPVKDHDKIHLRWQTNSEIFRQSNRSAATHALIALGCLGMKLVKASEANDNQLVQLIATEDEKVTLAQTEHNRWTAERLLAGFSYGERSDQPPRRPQLCTWEVLSNDPALATEPEKDFKQIETVFETLRRLGYALVKA